MSSAIFGGGRGRGRVPSHSSTEDRRQKSERGKQSGSSSFGRPGSVAPQGPSKMQRRNRPQARAPAAPHGPRPSSILNAQSEIPSSGADRKKNIEEEWQAIQKSMEEERSSAMARGLIADPEKPRSLAEAITTAGTCQDMCPKSERIQRLRSNDVWKEEWDPTHAPAKVEAQHRMVKKFRRAAAGTPEQLPSELRPPIVLQKTVDYLLRDLMNETAALQNIHHFVWDRTRAIRNDFSIQQVTELPDVPIAISCYERIARFHILSLHQLARSQKPYDMYDAFQEREQLSRTLLSLTQYYEDTRQQFRSPHEAEFRAYSIIRRIQDPSLDLEDRLQSWPRDIEQDPRVQTALKLYTAAANITRSQGALRSRQPHLVAQASWAGFWSLVRSNQTSYLMACVTEMYFPLIRKMALNALWRAYRQGGRTKSQDWRLTELVSVLAFDDEHQAQAFCEQFGFRSIEREDGMLYLDLSSVPGKQLRHPSSGRIDQSFSCDLVEFKRNGRPFSAIIDGMSVGVAQTRGLIEESEEDSSVDEEIDSDSLFVPASHGHSTDPRPRISGILENTLEKQELPDNREQASSREQKTSTTRSGSVTAAQKPFSSQEWPDVSKGLTDKPLSFGKPTHSPFETGTLNTTSVGFGRPSQFPTTTPTATFGFGKPSTAVNSGSLSSSGAPVISSLFSHTKPPAKAPGNSLTAHTNSQSRSPFALGEPLATTTDKTELTQTSIASAPISNPFAFSTTHTTGASTFASNPFALITTTAASESQFPVNPYTPTTAPTTNGAVQGQSAPLASKVDSNLPSSAASPITKERAPTSPKIDRPDIAYEEQEQLPPSPATSVNDYTNTVEPQPQGLGAAQSKEKSPFQSPSSPSSLSLPQSWPSQKSTKISEDALSSLPSPKNSPSSKYIPDPSESSTTAGLPKHAPLAPDQQIRSVMTPVSSSPSSMSLGGFKVSPAYQNKHQPSRPSPLSHVTTFAGDTSSPTLLQSTPSAAQQSSSTEDTVLPSKLTAQRQTTKLLETDSKFDILDALAAQALLDKTAGFLKQFVEYASSHEIESALVQFTTEKAERKALDVRNGYLARKYGHRWRENYWKRKMIKKGRERRRKKAKELALQAKTETKATIQETRRKFGDAIEGKRPLRQIFERSIRHRKRRSDELEADAVEGASKRQKARRMSPTSNSDICDGNNQFGADPVIFEHIRDPASFIQPRQRTIAQNNVEGSKHPPAPIKRDGLHNMALPPPVDGSSLPGRHDAFSWVDSSERASTTQSPYFRLKALGVDPNASGVRKRTRESSDASSFTAVEPDSPGKEARTSPPERKRLQTGVGVHSLSKSKLGRVTPATVPRTRHHGANSTDYSPAALRQYRVAADEADEALFARIRRVREANAHTASASSLPASRSGSRPESHGAPNSTPSRPQTGVDVYGATEDSDLLAQSRQIRQIMAESIQFFQEERKKEDESRSRASSRASPADPGESSDSSRNGGLGSSGRSQDIPKYRMRESKFVPRDMYGKWNEKGNLRGVRPDGSSIGRSRDKGAVHEGKEVGHGKDEGREKTGIDKNISTNPLPTGLVKSSEDAENTDGDDVEEEEIGDESFDENFDEEDDMQDEGFDDEDDEAEDDFEGKARFVPMGTHLGSLVSPVSDMAFGTSLPPFDPKGKTGTSADDAFELSD